MFCTMCNRTYRGCSQKHFRKHHGGKNAGSFQKVFDLERIEPRNNLAFQTDEIFHMIVFELNKLYNNFYAYLRYQNVPDCFLRKIFIIHGAHGSIGRNAPIENYSGLSAGIVYLCIGKKFRLANHKFGQ